jgi:hypothetical protein
VQPGDALRWKPLDMYAVAFVSRYNDFQHDQFIINAGSSQVVTGIIPAHNNANLFSVYPDPAQDDVQVKLMLTNAGDTKVELLTFDGKSVQENLYSNLPAGENDLKINFAGLAGGIYLVKIISPDGISISKIVHENF